MHLFDADSLMLANRHDFPLNKDPGTFWDFLEERGGRGEIRIPEAVFDEIKHGDDDLWSWLYDRRDIFFIPTRDCLSVLPIVLDAYGPLSDVDLEALNGKADPFLIAHATALNATVVTNEFSHPHATSPLNKKIPDICGFLGVSCIHYPRYLWEMSP